MTSQHAKRTYAARTAALRAPEKKLYRVSRESITHIQDELVEATTPYEAIEKWFIARGMPGTGLKLDAADKAKTYVDENGKLEMHVYYRSRAPRGTWSAWAVEAEVIR